MRSRPISASSPRAGPASTGWLPARSRNGRRPATVPTRALEADLAKLAETRSDIDGLVAGQVEKLAEGRTILTQALEADLAKLAESRSGIDGLVAGQVDKLAQGRTILTGALEADLAKLAESRSGIDGLVAGQVEKLAEGRSLLDAARSKPTSPSCQIQGPA